MRIICMGTSDFAVPALQALAESRHEVVLTVTRPDRPRDRGKKMQAPPVKQKAQGYGIPVLQPEKIKGNDEFFGALVEAAPDLIVVAAYGKILPVSILELPPLGCVNIHASLLPKYRGAAPIHRAVMNGEVETGVTLMHMAEGMDAGDIIAQRKTPVDRKNTSMLHDELAQMGAALLMELLPLLEAKTAPRMPQDDALATYAPMIFRQDGHIDFSRDPHETEQIIRAMTVWPGAFTCYGGLSLRLHEARALDERTDRPDGAILRQDAAGIAVACGGGVLLIEKLQMPGKRPLPAGEFLKGNCLDPAVVLQ